MHMVAQHFFKSRIQQMGGGVGPADGLAPLAVNGSLHAVAYFQRALGQMSIVHELSALILLHIRNCKGHSLRSNNAVVCHLAAHFRVERRLIQHHNAIAPGLYPAAQLILTHQGHHRSLAACPVIAHELRRRHILTEFHTGPAQIAQSLPSLPGPLLLLLHQSAEGILVHRQPLVRSHLGRQINGEAKGIIQLKSICAGEYRLALGLVLGQHLCKDAHTAVDGPGKALLLGADDLGDIGLLLPQITVLALIFMDHRVHDPIQERLIHAQ